MCHARSFPSLHSGKNKPRVRPAGQPGAVRAARAHPQGPAAVQLGAHRAVPVLAELRRAVLQPGACPCCASCCTTELPMLALAYRGVSLLSERGMVGRPCHAVWPCCELGYTTGLLCSAIAYRCGRNLSMRGMARRPAHAVCWVSSMSVSCVHHLQVVVVRLELTSVHTTAP